MTSFTSVVIFTLAVYDNVQVHLTSKLSISMKIFNDVVVCALGQTWAIDNKIQPTLWWSSTDIGSLN